ncbi:MAG: carboxypeptidase M32 [Minwuia thermotolerans]|nr:MAG: carboxypeptidase M32 [Minwuia thermotolerans]
MTAQTDALTSLKDRFRRRSLIEDALAMLYWDRSTLMPDGAADARTDQIAELTRMAREILVATETSDLLDQAEQTSGSLAPIDSRDLYLMRRAFLLETAVPADLVEAAQRAGARSEMAWRQNRAANDFAAQQPFLQEVMRLTQETAKVRGAAMGLDPYDAQLELFEPGLRDADVAPVFADLKSWLPDMVQQILERQAQAPKPIEPAGPFPVPMQKELGEGFMRALGFDFSRGRLDESLHPFTGGIPDDSRLTTRYSTDGFAEAMMGILHETGHALYEQGLPADRRHRMVGRSGGMALHESQSLIIEMQLCRGPAFLDHALPLIRQTFGDQSALETANFNRLTTRVERGLIRVDADEATYPLHIILRHGIEKALLSGDLPIADLPGAWNDGMADIVGIRPADDRNGCLQDIHWMDGAVGYFPTYTLGALAAAQLMAAMRAALPDLDSQVRSGDFSQLLGWLRRHVHNRGLDATTGEIISDATGSPLATDAFRSHLQARYLN